MKIENVKKKTSAGKVTSEVTSGSTLDLENGPESPGKWEVVPGSSQTRPQFIKVRPGFTLEEAVNKKKKLEADWSDKEQNQNKQKTRKKSTGSERKNQNMKKRPK